MNYLKETFEKIFNSEVIESNFISSKKKKGKKTFSINLVEDENEEKEDTLREVTIIGFDEIYFAIKYDKYPFIHGNSNSESKKSLLIEKDIRKKCDYIIWAKLDGQKIVLLIELKSKKNKDTLSKFKSSKLFLEYFNSILKEYYDKKIINFDKTINLLINNKSAKKLGKPNHNFNFFHKSIGSAETYYMKKDVEDFLFDYDIKT